MDYGEAYDYLKEKGCKFEFDNPGLFTFSKTHVFYNDEKIGIMDQYNMTFYTNGWCHQFNYKTMWYEGKKKFTDFMEEHFFK